MPAVISSSRGVAEIAAGGRPPGAGNTPKYVYSRYRDRSKRRRRHVRSRRVRFRRVTRAQVLKRRMIKLLDTCPPLASSLIHRYPSLIETHIADSLRHVCREYLSEASISI